jgi:drug/metabolite transporter (DMT)-like permease
VLQLTIAFALPLLLYAYLPLRWAAVNGEPMGLGRFIEWVVGGRFQGALFASLGQWCMTRAYSQGATLVVANLQYSGIVFGALYSLLLFGDHIPLAGWLGMALIVASGIAATVLRARAAPDAPGEEH